MRNKEINLVHNRNKYKVHKQLPKEVNHFFNKSHTMSVRKTEEAETKWVAILCSRAGQINILKMPLLYKAICRFYEDLFKILTRFLNRNWKKRTFRNLYGSIKVLWYLKAFWAIRVLQCLTSRYMKNINNPDDTVPTQKATTCDWMKWSAQR